MKNISFVFLLAVVGWGRASVAQAPAESAAPASKVNVSMELQCLVLPEKAALPLAARLRGGPDVRVKGWAEAQQMIADGTASMAGWVFLLAETGERAIVEDIEEVRYATDSEPGPNAELLVDHVPIEREKASTARGRHDDELEPSFETRNVGVTFEAEPKLHPDGHTLLLEFVAQHVRLKSMDRVKVERQDGTEKKTELLSFEMPRFVDLKVQTKISVVSGEHTLLGIFHLPGDEQLVELFLLSVESQAGK